MVLVTHNLNLASLFTPTALVLLGGGATARRRKHPGEVVHEELLEAVYRMARPGGAPPRPRGGTPARRRWFP